MTKLTVKNNKKINPKKKSMKKLIGGNAYPYYYEITLYLISFIKLYGKGEELVLDSIFSGTKNNRIKTLEKEVHKMKIEIEKNKPLSLKAYDYLNILLEKQLEKMNIEMIKNKPLHLKVYDGTIKLFERYPKLLAALGVILTPALIYKLSKNILGTKVTKVASPPKSIVRLMKMYLKKAS